MKTNAIMRINSKPVVKTKSSAAMVKPNHYIEINNDVDHLWQMYQAQLQRNGELMTIIDRQQQFIQQVINKGVANSFITEAPQLPAIPLPEFKDLIVDTLNAISIHFKKIFRSETKRLDAVHSMIKLLYILHQMGGSAFPEQLFEKANIGKSTGFRNVMFLQNKYLIKKVGGKFNTRYKITQWGKQFLDCTLEEGYNKFAHAYADPEEGKKAWEPYMNLEE